MKKYSLSHRDIYGNKYKPPSALSVAIATVLRDLLGILILALCILTPVYVAALLQP